MYRLFTRTWKKLVEPSVMMGDRTSLFETTCIRKTSAMERLKSYISERLVETDVVHRLQVSAVQSRDKHLRTSGKDVVGL